MGIVSRGDKFSSTNHFLYYLSPNFEENFGENFSEKFKENF